MPRNFDKEKLRQLRNQVDIAGLIVHLGLPAKNRDGHLRFLCPLCSEFHTATNPATNLARCFRCARNFNPIDLVMAVHEVSFVDAVYYLIKTMPRVRSPPPSLRS